MSTLFGTMLSRCYLSIIFLFTFPIFLFEFSTNQIEYHVGKFLLDEKREELADYFLKRRLELDKNMRNLLDKAQFNCGVEDKNLLASINKDNDTISVYGMVTLQGELCSNIGGVLLPGLGEEADGFNFSSNGKRINVSEVGEGDTLFRLSKKQGELFWLVRSAKIDAALNTPCKSCFSVNGFFPWAQVGLNLGDRHILSEREVRTVTILQDPPIGEIVLSVGENFREYVKEVATWVVFLGLFLYYTVYLSILFALFSRRNTLHGKIKAALLRSEFIPFYQPILDAGTHTIVGVEVLVRWRKRDGVIVSPAIFMESMEGSGLMLEMTSQLLQKVVKDMDSLADEIWVSVNICSELLESGDLYNLLANLGWPYRQRLCFELTERLPIYNVDNSRQQIERLNKQGYHIKIDDFGAGYGGFSYLNNFQIRHIKIDKMFVDAIGNVGQEKYIIDGIILSAQRCGLQIIAEGVEHHYQSVYLLERGVTMQQGYLFYKPVSFYDLPSSCVKYGNNTEVSLFLGSPQKA